MGASLKKIIVLIQRFFVLVPLIFFIFFLFSLNVQAKHIKLKTLIAHDVQNFLDESLQPAKFSVKVIYESSEPQVRCKVSDSYQTAGYKWAYCKVDLEILVSGSQALRTCTFLFHYHPRKYLFDLTRQNDGDSEKCLRNLWENFG